MTDEFLPKSDGSTSDSDPLKPEPVAIPFWGTEPLEAQGSSTLKTSPEEQIPSNLESASADKIVESSNPNPDENLRQQDNFWASNAINNEQVSQTKVTGNENQAGPGIEIDVGLDDFPIYEWDSDNDALKIIDWYNQNSEAPGKKNLDFFKSKSGVQYLSNDADAQKILDSVIQTLQEEGCTEWRPPYNYHSDHDEDGGVIIASLDLTKYQNKQVGFAIIGFLLIIASAIFFPLGILRFQEMNEFFEYSEEAEDWPSVQVNNDSWAYAYYDESCSYDSESGETCSYDYEFGAQVFISCMQDENATWICDDSLENGTVFSGWFFCTSGFFAERGEGDMPYPCAAMDGMDDTFGGGQSFPLNLYDYNGENGIYDWIVYDGECIWNDGHRDSVDDSWSCYNSYMAYDTWWYYCEYKENYGLWLCTDDLGENSGASTNREETRAPTWVVLEASYLTESTEDFSIKYDPDNPNRMYLEQANPLYVAIVEPIMVMAITPLVFMYISFRIHKWASDGFLFKENEDN